MAGGPDWNTADVRARYIHNLGMGGWGWNSRGGEVRAATSNAIVSSGTIRYASDFWKYMYCTEMEFSVSGFNGRTCFAPSRSRRLTSEKRF